MSSTDLYQKTNGNQHWPTSTKEPPRKKKGTQLFNFPVSTTNSKMSYLSPSTPPPLFNPCDHIFNLLCPGPNRATFLLLSSRLLVPHLSHYPNHLLLYPSVVLTVNHFPCPSQLPISPCPPVIPTGVSLSSVHRLLTSISFLSPPFPLLNLNAHLCSLSFCSLHVGNFRQPH